MAGSLIAGFLLNTTLTAAATVGGAAYFTFTAVAFAANLVISQVIQKIFAPKGPGAGSDPGVQQRIAVSTSNKVGVIYGNAWIKGVDLWGAVPNDRKTGYFLTGLALNAGGNAGAPIQANTLNSVYWQEYKLTLDSDGWVTNAADQAGNNITDFNDQVRVQFFSNGIANITSPIDVNDATAYVRDSDNKWTGYTGALITVKYNHSKQIYRLEDMTFNISNNFVNAGQTIRDFLTSPRYGAGLPASRIHNASINALSQYGNARVPVMVGSRTYNVPRYTLSGVINPSQDTWSNFESLCQSCGCLPYIDPTTGQYGVFIDRPGTSVYTFTDVDFVGNSQLNTAALNDTANSIDALYPRSVYIDSETGAFVADTRFKGQQDNVNFSLPSNLVPVNAPINKITATYAFCNNNAQAQRLAALNLNQNTLDLAYTFNTNHLSLGVAAGDVVGITHPFNGWNNKLFRVLQVNEEEDGVGGIKLEYTVKEYSADIYVDSMVVQSNPAPNINFPSQRALANFVPATPTITNIDATAAIPQFTLNLVNSPASGTTQFPTEFMEIYFGTSLNPDSDRLLTTLTPSMDTFAPGQMVPYVVTGLTAGTYYFRTRYYAGTFATQFSERTTALAWNPQPVAQVTGEALNTLWSPSAIFVPTAADGTSPVYTNATSMLQVFAGASLVPYSTASTDAGMPNNSYRITASNTSSGLSVSGPTGASGATSVSYTVTSLDASARSGTLTVTLRYKNNAGVTSDAGSTILTVAQQRSGISPPTVAISGYQAIRRTSAGTYVPANLTFTAVINNIPNPVYSWSISGGTPATASGSTVVVTPNANITALTVSLSVTGTGGIAQSYQIVCPVVLDGATGQVGDAGMSYANPTLYQWNSNSTPPGISGTSIYTWSNGTLSNIPVGWFAADPGSQIQGQYRWQISAPINARISTGSETSEITWSNYGLPRATAYNGTQGAVGPQGPNGPAGPTGNPGAAEITILRGSEPISPPTDSEVMNIILRRPITGDLARVYNTVGGYQAYQYILGNWIAKALYIPGDVLVDGSLSANKLVSALELAAGQYLQVGQPITNPEYTNIISGSGAVIDGGPSGGGRFALGGTASSIVGSGTSITLNGAVVATGNISGLAASEAFDSGNSGAGASSVSRVITVPTGASAVFIIPDPGPIYSFESGKGDIITGPDYTITANNVTIPNIVVTPPAGNYTITLTRSNYNPTSTCRVQIIVLKR